MAYYDIKEIKYTVKQGGGTMRTSYCGSIGFQRPQSQREAEQMAMTWLQKKYPNAKIEDLQVILK